MKGTIRYLESELNLPVNREKSEVAKVKRCCLSRLSDSQGKDTDQSKGKREVQDQSAGTDQKKQPIIDVAGDPKPKRVFKRMIAYFRVQEDIQ